jgi:hypothetical protein
MAAVLRISANRGLARSVPTPPTPAFVITADGIWTWFTDPRAVVRGGYLYTMAVDSAGTNFVHRTLLSTQVTESFQLSSTGLEIDDHNNGSITFLPDGRAVCFYGAHNDSEFRYRIWDGTGAFTSSGSWTSEAARGTSEGP